MTWAGDKVARLVFAGNPIDLSDGCENGRVDPVMLDF